MTGPGSARACEEHLLVCRGIGVDPGTGHSLKVRTLERNHHDHHDHHDLHPTQRVDGFATLIFACQVAEFSGTSAGVEYTIGVSFVVFAVGVLALAARPAVLIPGLLLTIGNVLFTVATVVVVVLAGVWPLTTAGVALVLGTGVYTLVMAELQYQGVRRIAKA